MTTIHRDFLPEDWRHASASVGMDAAVLVQSQASGRDTAWLLELADTESCVAGVVGWIDMLDRAAERIAALATHPALCGLRPMLQSLPDDDWILSPRLDPAIEAMIANDLCFDALVAPRHLPYLLRFAERHPRLRIVVDHAAKPDIAHGVHEPWCGWMTRLAALPNVSCKLSGLLTEAGEYRTAGDLRPWVDHLLTTFGTERLLWGSDWPVLNGAGNYAQWFRMADALTGLQGEERMALFGGNAKRVYGING